MGSNSKTALHLAVGAGPGLWCLGSPPGLSSCTKLDWLPHMAISGEFSKKPNVETARPFEVRGWDLHKVTFSKFLWLKQVTRPAQDQEVEN